MDPVNILKDVIAYVEVRSNNDNRSAAVCRELESLGAKVETSFTDEVTHVVYKEGLKRTYLKAQKKGIPLVSVSWLESCKRNQQKMPVADFTALVEKEPESLLIKMKQNRRWKKMKSMQPCDFDEEVARSAERNKKQRRRVELANRFKLAEDATPPGGSPALVLAMDTQARSSSPFFGNSSSSRLSSPFQTIVPETPATPTMKERIEKMRKEQRDVLGAGVDSPKSSVLETAMLQRKLFEKLAKDIFSVNSSDEEDDGETTARVVAKLMKGMESPSDTSGVSTPVRKKSDSSNAGTRDDGEGQSDEKELEAIFFSGSPANTKNEFNSFVNHGNKSGNTPPPSGSSRKSLSCRKENQTKIGAELVREGRHSTGSSSEDSFVLSPMCSNKVPSLATDPSVSELATDLGSGTTTLTSNLGASASNLTSNVEASSISKLTSNLGVSASELTSMLEASGSKSKGKGPSVESTPKSTKAARKTKDQPTKPKTINKRKLFSDPLFSKAVLPLEEEGCSSKKTSEISSSCAEVSTTSGKLQVSKGKGKRNTEAADVSFLFSGAVSSDKANEKTTVTSRRRSKRLSVINLSSLSSARSVESGNQDTFSGETSKLLSMNDTNTAGIRSTSIRQTRHSLGTSMSVLYGTDSTMLNSSTVCPSRRSIDEFSTRPLNNKSKKNITSNQNKKYNSKSQTKRSLNVNDGSLEENSQKNQKLQEENPTKKRKVDRPSSDHTQEDSEAVDHKDTGSGSDSSVERLAIPCGLRHAHSLIMESTTCKNTGTGRRQPSLVMTSLHRDEQEAVRSIAKKLGMFRLTDNVDTTTTHVVCGEPRRTLNLLRGIAGGCWILKKEWVFESLEANTWLMEENYEMAEEFPAAKEYRLKRQTLGKMYRADLFSHLGLIFVSSNTVPPRQQLVYLIASCSGKVTSSKQRASLFIGMEHLPDKTIVKPTWILDSVMNMSLQDPGDYIIPATYHRRENSPEF